MSPSIHRTSIQIDFPAGEEGAKLAREVVKGIHDAGQGKARTSGVGQNKVKIDRSGGFGLPELMQILESSGVAHLASQAKQIGFRLRVQQPE